MVNTRTTTKRKHSEDGGLYQNNGQNQTGNIAIYENRSNLNDKDKFKSKVQITLKVEQFSEFANNPVGHRRYSEPVYIRAFPWKIFVQLAEMNNEKWLGFYVYCAQPRDHEWYCKASYTLTLKSHKEELNDQEWFDQREFNSTVTWAFGFVHKKCDELLNSANGWLQDDTIIVTANITVTGRYGQIHKFTPKTPDILYVNGNAVEVNKHFLASQSRYFKSLFFENFKEKQDHKIDEPELDFADFKLLLDLANSFVNRTLPEGKIERIMELSHEYDFQFVMEICDQVLEQEECKKSLFEKFRLASKFRRNDLKAILLGLLTKEKFNKLIKNHFGDYKKLEGEMMRELVDNIPDE